MTRFQPRIDPVRPDLATRRRRVLGSTYSLFYDRPVHLVRGEGVWLFDEAGERYLDAYNNVASVGHCHPDVVAALSRQAAILNTHTRYLDETVVDYAEALLATVPDHLGHAMFTCTGSEANDLAVRVAEHATGGKGVIITAFAYHGATAATAALSPAAGGLRVLGPSNRAIPAPDTFRDGGRAAREFTRSLHQAIDAMHADGQRPAALIIDTAFSSDGIFMPDPACLADAGDIIRGAGALLIADEVQAGFGRLGGAMWGFQRYGLEPDIVTLGKPMGDGHPLAGVMLRPRLVEGFGSVEGYFNTFGGNPVSAAVGLAVLDVIARENLVENARRVGVHLQRVLGDLARRHRCVADIRGSGLYWGVEFGMGGRALAGAVVNGMRERHVLIGACGPDGNILKIRPPLPFGIDHADLLVAALDDVLTELA